MDNELKEFIERASERGNKYIKGQATFTELPEKLAELGILLLEKAKIIPDLQGDKLRETLIEIQNKVDDLRTSIFTNKIQIK